jgi:HK97 family phage prohead protease
MALLGVFFVSETKYIDCRLVDLKRESVLETGQFEGHGAVFNNVDFGGDRIQKGAFRNSLASYKQQSRLPPMLWAHDSSIVIGRWDSITEDDYGLRVRGTLAKTPKGEETRQLLLMGAIDGMSIGYKTADAEFDREGNRVLKQIDLFEVSLVSMPMNTLARVAAAKGNKGICSITEWERVMRQTFGWSRSTATRFASQTYKHFDAANKGGEAAAGEALLENLNETIAADVLRNAASRIRSIEL